MLGIVLIHIVEYRVQANTEVGQIQRGQGHDDRLDIDGGKAGQQRPGGQRHQKQRTQHLQRQLAAGMALFAPAAGLLLPGVVMAGGVIDIRHEIPPIEKDSVVCMRKVIWNMHKGT